MSFFSKFSSSNRRITFGLSIIQLVKAILSFFTVLISSAYFGASLERDVWILSLAIVSIANGIFFGPIIQIFRVKFVMTKENEGERKALISFGSLLSYMLVISLIIIGFIELLPQLATKIFTRSYSNDENQIFITILRIIGPTLIFGVFTAVLSGLLNIYNVYYVPEIMSILTSVINVLMILFFADRYGIYALVWSNYISNILLVATLFYFIYKNGIPIFKYLNLKLKYTFEYLKMSFPFYFTYFIAQFQMGLENALSGFLGVGNVSVLDYSRKFVAIPIGIIQSTTNIILAPALSKMYINEGEKPFMLELSKFIDLFLLICMPIITIFVICPEEIVRIFLVRGAFDLKYIEPTKQALFWFGFGIISVIFYSTVTQALVAQGKVKITAIITSLMGFLILAVNLIFFKRFGIQVLAFSWSASHLLVGIILYFMISSIHKSYLLNEFMRKISLIAIVLLSSFFLYQLIKGFSFHSTSNFNSMILLFIITACSILFEVGLIYLLRFKEKEIITQFLKNQIFKKPE